MNPSYFTIRQMAWLPCLITAVTALGVFTSYLLSAAYGHVPWCNPYWDSCTSISATGRHPPGFFTFKATLLPVAGLMMVYWYLASQWLRSLQPASLTACRTVFGMGLAASIALILYTTMLGAVGDLYQLQRRIGITLFFGLTAFAHLYLVARLFKLPPTQRPWLPGIHVQLTLSGLLLTGGLLNSILKVSLVDQFDHIEDAIEWIFATLMIAQFLVTGLIWKHAVDSGHSMLR